MPSACRRTVADSPGDALPCSGAGLQILCANRLYLRRRRQLRSPTLRPVGCCSAARRSRKGSVWCVHRLVRGRLCARLSGCSSARMSRSEDCWRSSSRVHCWRSSPRCSPVSFSTSDRPVSPARPFDSVSTPSCGRAGACVTPFDRFHAVRFSTVPRCHGLRSVVRASRRHLGRPLVCTG